MTINIEIHEKTQLSFKERPGLALLLTVIANKVIERQNKINNIRKKLNEEIKKYEKDFLALKIFEEEHLEELVRLCPSYAKSYGPNFFANAFENLHRIICELRDHEKFQSQELYDLLSVNKDIDSEVITYDQFHESTGISAKIIKELLSEL